MYINSNMIYQLWQKKIFIRYQELMFSIVISNVKIANTIKLHRPSRARQIVELCLYGFDIVALQID